MGSDFFYISLSGDAAQKMRFAENPERGEGTSWVFWSNYVVSFTNQDILSSEVAANVKGLFLAHTHVQPTLSGGRLMLSSLRVKGSSTQDVISYRGGKSRELESLIGKLVLWPEVTHVTSADIYWLVIWPCPTARGQGSIILPCTWKRRKPGCRRTTEISKTFYNRLFPHSEIPQKYFKDSHMCLSILQVFYCRKFETHTKQDSVMNPGYIYHPSTHHYF